MGKALSNRSSIAAGSIAEARPFQQAAVCARFIGVAALTLGAVSLYAGRQSAADSNHDASAAYVIFALMFIVPGVLYLALASFVVKQRRWAVITSLLLAMLDMTLLGILFVTSWGAPGAAMMCLLAGLFVVALAVMTTFLGRSLESIKQNLSSSASS